MADRRPIPLRPDASALRAATVGALARAIIVKAHARLENRRDETGIMRSRFPDDQSALLMLRAASSPTTTTTAPALVRTAVADIIASIGAVGAGARLLQSGLLLSFDDGVGTVSVPGGAVSANKAAFIEESAPIPVNDLVATAATLLPHKLSSIFTLTSEMVSGSNAEALIAEAMLRCVGLALDNVRFECQWRQCYPTSRPALQRPQRREDRRTNRGGGGAGARHHPQFAFAVWRTGVAGGRANRHAARYEGAGSAGPGSSRARSTRR